MGKSASAEGTAWVESRDQRYHCASRELIIDSVVLGYGVEGGAM